MSAEVKWVVPKATVDYYTKDRKTYDSPIPIRRSPSVLLNSDVDDRAMAFAESWIKEQQEASRRAFMDEVNKKRFRHIFNSWAPPAKK
jgi:hypothetical protein